MKHTPGTRALTALAAVGLVIVILTNVADSPPGGTPYVITGIYVAVMIGALVEAARHRDRVRRQPLTWAAAGWAALVVLVTVAVASVAPQLDGTVLLALVLPVQPLLLILGAAWWWRRSTARRSAGS